MIEIKDLHYTYDQHKILNFPDWYVPHGQQGIIYGPSACGKSTLIGILSGILEIQAGRVHICDTNFNNLSRAERDEFRSKNIGMVFSRPFLNNVISVYENLAIVQQLTALKEDYNRIFELLQEINLSDKAFSRISDISRVEARRLAVARAFIQNPRLILADEPLSGLDNKEGKQVIEVLIEQSHKHEASLIIATHDSRLKDIFQNQLNLKN